GARRSARPPSTIYGHRPLGVLLHLNIEHAVPRDDEVIRLGVVAALVAMCYCPHILVLEGQLALYPGDPLLVPWSGPRFASWPPGGLIIDFTCWHFLGLLSRVKCILGRYAARPARPPCDRGLNEQLWKGMKP